MTRGQQPPAAEKPRRSDRPPGAVPNGHFADPHGEEHLFEGVVEGRIIDREEGHEGFGYDPLFIPDGYDKTFAQMSTEEKNEVSHRARAVRKLAAYLHSAGK